MFRVTECDQYQRIGAKEKEEVTQWVKGAIILFWSWNAKLNKKSLLKVFTSFSAGTKGKVSKNPFEVTKRWSFFYSFSFYLTFSSDHLPRVQRCLLHKIQVRRRSVNQAPHIKYLMKFWFEHNRHSLYTLHFIYIWFLLGFQASARMYSNISCFYTCSNLCAWQLVWQINQ